MSFLAVVLLSATCFAQPGYEKTSTGISFQTQGMNVSVRFYTPQIVRVTKTPVGVVDAKLDWVIRKEAESMDFDCKASADKILLASHEIQISCDARTGAVEFLSSGGERLVAEKPYGTTFSALRDKDENYSVMQSFELDPQEAVYGLGQQQTGLLNQRNQTLELTNRNTRVCIPIIQSTKGYGIYWDQYSKSRFRDGEQGMSMESVGRSADYYFIYGGNMKNTLALYRELTGDAPMFPLWAYGFFQSRERYKTQEEPVEVIETYRKLGVPVDCIIQDWQYWGENPNWNAMQFVEDRYPDPQAMVDKIHGLNARMMVVIWPGFGVSTRQYADFKQRGWLLGFDTYPGKGTRPYDCYNPEARDLYWSYVRDGLLKYGFDGWWMDSTEPDNSDNPAYEDLPTHCGAYKTVFNAYPLNTVKGVYEHQRAEDGAKRIFILTRSAFAGQQCYGANVWSGDVGSDFPTLERQIPAGVNLSMSGIPYWNTDIGGFWGNRNNPDFPEIYTRWMQFATFTPMMRSHGTGVEREIYTFGKRGDWAFDVQEKFIKLRYTLLPYNYSTAWGVTHRGETFMKPLAMDFPEDRKVYDLSSEYMYGDAFLVAPVMAKGQEQKEVYLPEGTVWYDYWKNTPYTGGQTICCATPIESMPLFVRGGSILPLGPDVQYAEEKSWERLDINVYPGADGRFILYEDENDTYNYEKGMYSEIEFVWDEARRILTVKDRRGGFEGMIAKRKFTIHLIGGQSKTINYSGREIRVKF